MRRALFLSFFMHIAVGAIGYFGSFFWSTDPALVESAIVVEVVQVADKTNVPAKKQQAAEAKSENRNASPVLAKNSLPRVDNEPRFEPKRRSPDASANEFRTEATQPSKVAGPPLAKPKLNAKPQAPTSEAFEVKSKSEERRQFAKAQPKPSPESEPPISFTSVLKTVEELKRKAQTGAVDEKQGDTNLRNSSEEEQSSSLSQSQSAQYTPSQPVTMSEIDLVRRQIERCWNLPAGAKDADNLVVSIRVEMDMDGTPRAASVVEQARMRGDPYFRAAAESALRAVLNPQCHPFTLPRRKYENWKTMTLVFNPKEMFGT